MKYLINILILSSLIVACSDCGPVDQNKENELNLYDYNVIALYSFNNTLKDKSLNKIDLEGSNIYFSLDRNDNVNSSLFLNNKDNYPSTNPKFNDTLNLSGRFTISLWVKPELDSCLFDIGNYIDLIGRWGGTGNGNSSYSLVLLSDTTIQGRTYNTTEGNTWITTKAKLKDNKWNNIIMTRDENGMLSIFLNGKIAIKNYVASPQPSNYELYIGKRRDNRSLFYGYIDDVIILNENVPDGEIKKLMNINLK